MMKFKFWQSSKTAVAPEASAHTSFHVDDIRSSQELLKFLRGLSVVSVDEALGDPTVLHCVSLISRICAMIPLNAIDKKTKNTVELPVQDVLHRRPNSFQTAFNFRELMTRNLLIHGVAYAKIIRSRGKVTGLIPLYPPHVERKLNSSFRPYYIYRPEKGASVRYDDGEVLCLMIDSEDGIEGQSRVKLAATTIGLSRSARIAAHMLFQNGMQPGGALEHPERLSADAYERLKKSMSESYEGPENAGRWLILEEGLKMSKSSGASSARDSQNLETRKHQAEDILRIFGVPRPLAFMDDTSWGSGVAELMRGFIQFTMNPYFEVWEQGITLSCLNDAERLSTEIKFNPSAMIRGNMAQQGEYFAKALGSGGHPQWMSVKEIRQIMDLPAEFAPDQVQNGQQGQGDEA